MYWSIWSQAPQSLLTLQAPPFLKSELHRNTLPTNEVSTVLLSYNCYAHSWKNSTNLDQTVLQIPLATVTYTTVKRTDPRWNIIENWKTLHKTYTNRWLKLVCCLVFLMLLSIYSWNWQISTTLWICKLEDQDKRGQCNFFKTGSHNVETDCNRFSYTIHNYFITPWKGNQFPNDPTTLGCSKLFRISLNHEHRLRL